MDLLLGDDEGVPERLLEHVGTSHRLDQPDCLQQPDFPVEVVREMLGGDSHETSYEPLEPGVEGVDVSQGKAASFIVNFQLFLTLNGDKPLQIIASSQEIFGFSGFFICKRVGSDYII